MLNTLVKKITKIRQYLPELSIKISVSFFMDHSVDCEKLRFVKIKELSD